MATSAEIDALVDEIRSLLAQVSGSEAFASWYGIERNPATSHLELTVRTHLMPERALGELVSDLGATKGQVYSSLIRFRDGVAAAVAAFEYQRAGGRDDG